ncbi:MAG: tetratricopeptide repeat protein [Saprospiraceae bacterium]|nr:tetratricopeptide repeat protein [Saprospiraceae bacterium]
MNEILYEFLRKYRLHQLSAEEQTAFEQRLTDDPAFAQEVSEYATMLAAIQQEGDRQLEARLSEYAQELLQAEKEPVLQTSNVRAMNTYRKFFYAATAVLALLLAALPFLLNEGPGQTPEQLFAAHFATPAAPAVRDAAPSAWQTAYAQGDYAAAVAGLQQLLGDASFARRSEALLYLGVSQLALGKADEALAALRQVSSDSYDWDAAQWYTALALLKAGKVDEAKIIVDDVVHQNGHPFQKEAKALKAQL